MAELTKQDARQRKMEEIRVRIENGTYKIDSADLAAAIIKAIAKEEKRQEEDGQAA